MRFERPLGGRHYKKRNRPSEEALRHELGCNFHPRPEASWWSGPAPLLALARDSLLQIVALTREQHQLRKIQP